MRDVIETARKLATCAHEGQLRRDGTPYITHPAAVASRVPEAWRPVAWLHDILEDCAVTASDLRSAGLPESVVTAVEAITKREGEEYVTYLERVCANPDAAVVKCADIVHNLSDHPKASSREKYLTALPRLLEVAATVWPEVYRELKVHPYLTHG